ncbi:hypothetical protein NA57DRAFT_54569 [Rhizodiscina lignyota]|uniref:Pinin/SDK/MemA protein domain-containing protein n=1 Tax=Rhizodiscina lignyota TaxID=1504668 RepID=A0A9P4IJP5_9PEZI|nr:hypothetical protein NA57DRAFT_54569 [Rhizodiscina lignyota]
MVESAVVVPAEPLIESQASPPPPQRNGSLKRRQSSISSISSKRPRLSFDGAPESRSANSPTQDTPAPIHSPERAPLRKASIDMDKKRAKRMFGNFLGAISQKSETVSQRKRADVEKRAQAKLRQQSEEDEAARQQKLEEIQKKRKEQQVVWEEKSVEVRHSNMRATANFLRTDAEPHLYYKPYELRPSDKERIERQVKDVEEIIESEKEELEKRRQARLDATEAQMIDQTEHGEEDRSKFGDPGAVHEEAAASEEQGASKATNGDSEDASQVANGAPTALIEHENNKEMADDGGEVVEGEEDTVIY